MIKTYMLADLSLAKARLQDLKEKAKEALRAGKIGELVRLNEEIRKKEREIRIMEKTLGKRKVEVRSEEG